MSGTVLFRTDASPQIGIGHLMRSLALAEAWKNAGGRPVFASNPDPAAEAGLARRGLERRVLASGEQGGPADAAETVRAAAEAGASCVVTDGPRFGGDYQRRLKRSGLRVVAVDDEGLCGPYAADAVLNPGPGAGEDLYRDRETYTRLALGPSYALIREEFARRRAARRETPRVARRLLVSMGGSDDRDAIRPLLQALRGGAVPVEEAVVIAGPANPHLADVELAARAAGFPVRVLREAADMSEWMIWADAAISGAGAIGVELAFMGLPSVLWVLAENQRRNAEALAAAGAAVSAGEFSPAGAPAAVAKLAALMRDAAAREAMCSKGRALVDGLGAGRAAELIKEMT